MIKSTRDALIRTYYDMFPDGWYISLYGYPIHHQKRWNWRTFTHTWHVVVDYSQRIELTRRMWTPIRLEDGRIIPKFAEFTYDKLQSGIYDRIALHPSYGDTAPVDMTPLAMDWPIRINGTPLSDPGDSIRVLLDGFGNWLR